MFITSGYEHSIGEWSRISLFEQYRARCCLLLPRVPLRLAVRRAKSERPRILRSKRYVAANVNINTHRVHVVSLPAQRMYGSYQIASHSQPQTTFFTILQLGEGLK